MMVRALFVGGHCIVGRWSLPRLFFIYFVLYYLFDGHCGVSWLLLMCRWRPLHCPLVATASKLDGVEGERHHAGPAGDCRSVWGTDAYPLC